MFEFEFSSHSIEQMQLRDIDPEIVLEVVRHPDTIDRKDSNQEVYQKLIMFGNNKNYLVRVIVNTSVNPKLIITVYRTSKLNKYI